MIICKDHSKLNDLNATIQKVALPLAIVGYVQNEEDAFELIIQSKPDVILIDYIPNNDQGNLFLKLHDKLIFIPCFYVGDLLAFDQMQKAAVLGIEDCLSWPVDVSTLEGIFSSLYSKARNTLEAVHWVLDKYYQYPINIGNLAKEHSKSVNQLIRSFKAKYGLSPLQFLISKRMDRAMFLLLSTNMNIKMIAHVVGYPNVKYFNRLFTQYFGQTAASCRKNRAHQENDTLGD